jgi:hypothetical protein
MEGLIRQGDILLTPVGALPYYIERDKRTARVKRKKGEGIIVAAGEATGHHHRIRTKSVVMYRDGINRYIRVPEGGAELTHEEHETLMVPAGVYKVEHQREYQPQAAPVRVYD